MHSIFNKINTSCMYFKKTMYKISFWQCVFIFYLSFSSEL